MRKIILYTDLDGTLLDHHTYSWEPARPALEQAIEMDFPIIFNTSKTFNEVAALQKEVGISDPYIMENGGAIWIPEYYFPGHQGGLEVLGVDSQTILSKIETLRKNYRFKGYSQMSHAEIASLTGLSEESAALAAQRSCSEPLVWLDSEEQMKSFTEIINSLGLQIVKGGRFYHLSGHSNKGQALKYLQTLYRSKFPEHTCLSVALGDSPNDLSMLEVADLSVVIQRADGTYLSCEGKDVRPAGGMGPEAWNKQVLSIIDEMFLRR